MARAAQGSGSAGWVVVGVLVALHCCSLLASSVTLAVGDTQGWTIGPNYTVWAASQTFVVGDVLFFSYSQGSHNVVEATKAGYDACSTANANTTFTEGDTNVTLSTAGAHYFLCGFPGHCTAGMKLAVTVGAGAAPAPAPGTTPSPTPALAPVSATPPSPTPAPASVPTPVPAPTITSSSTPSPTPAATPSSPAPASTATPPGPASTPSSPSPGVPSSTTSSPPSPTPPSSAPALLSSTSLVTILLSVGGAFLAL